AAVCVALCYLQVAEGIHLGDRAVILRDGRVGRVDNAGRVPIGHVEFVWPGREKRRTANVAHERNRLAIHRPVDGQLRLRRETGVDLRRINRESTEQRAARGQLIEKNGRRDAEVAIGSVVVEDEGVRSIEKRSRRSVAAAGTARDSNGYRASPAKR